MKQILVIGLGRYGRNVAETLAGLGHQVMVVDKEEEKVQAVLPLAANGQIGDSTNAEFLKSLGIKNYDVCIVGIGDDFQNSLETTSLLKELGARFVVARAVSDVHYKFLLRNGADAAVYPEGQAGKWTAVRYTVDHILDYISINSEYGIVEIGMPPNWVGKTVGELDVRKKYNVNIVAVKEDGVLNMEIRPDIEFTARQTVLLLGNLQKMRKHFNEN